ncbi:MAG: GGDEF domain-containing protein [Desulfovibrio sp.]|jgi:diguanylate cyclase (GGDEF)-like protein|nr:GGDEF domain-containing protein [Desulfovibrio sp.]
MNGSYSERHLPAPGAAPVDTARHTADGDALADALVEYLLHVLSSPLPKDDPPPDALRNIDNFEELLGVLRGIRDMSLALSGGDLYCSTPQKGITIAALKTLQANLRHLNWLVREIARGRYGHQVDFLGEFSEAFNSMIEQLTKNIRLLLITTEEYKGRAFRDALTGIYNRYAFMLLAEDVFGTMRPATSTLIITDIDKFKNFNDAYGHICGDEVLKNVAACITRALRPFDIFCRYGGEEFLVLQPGMPLTGGLTVGERLRTGLEKMRLNFGGEQLRITASFGVSEIGPMPADLPFQDFITACINRADANLYTAKASGRNKVVG